MTKRKPKTETPRQRRTRLAKAYEYQNPVRLDFLRQLFGAPTADFNRFLRSHGVPLRPRPVQAELDDLIPLMRRLYAFFKRGMSDEPNKTAEDARLKRLQADKLEGTVIDRQAVAIELQQGLVLLKERLGRIPIKLSRKLKLTKTQENALKLEILKTLNQGAKELDARRGKF